MDTAKLVSHSADVVVLKVLTDGQAYNIRQHCEADILAQFGVSHLEFEIATEPMNARRWP
ncbi:hypothetical protein CDS [Bradyrhizobium sp.]|nr:hypothetical protein CDS [Bradyrhizobium sp.]